MNNFFNTADKKSSWKYWSTTFTLNRGCWLMDFTKLLFGRFVEEREESLPKVGQYAYNGALAHRHNWFIRKTANWLCNMVASRETFVKSLCAE